MGIFMKQVATTGIAMLSIGAIAIAPTIPTPPKPVERSVHLAAATTPTVIYQPLVQQPVTQQTTDVLGSLLSLHLGTFIIPPSLGQPFPTPQLPGPVPTPNGFEDAIINTYHAIEPWVRYGFELATYAVGWVPWVGWLSPQIMIFYNFGERIVESLVVNSANWLWGPLPFGAGLRNVARDSWNALLQLGRDEWNFWLPPLPPLPFSAQQTQDEPVSTATQAAVEPSVEPLKKSSHPLRDLLAALRDRLVGADRTTPQNVEPPVSEPAVADATDPAAPAAPAEPVDEKSSQADVSKPDIASTTPEETNTALGALGKPHRFRVHPTLGASETPAETSNESVGEPKSSVEASDHSTGKSDPPKKRFERPRNHRLADAHRDSAATTQSAA